MHAFVALAVRCLIALALAANGGFATAHAHVAAGGDAMSLSSDPPCHGDPEPGAHDLAGATPPADCCGQACVCGCVLAPMTVAIVHLALPQPLPESVPSRLVAAPGSAIARRLLRPPIA